MTRRLLQMAAPHINFISTRKDFSTRFALAGVDKTNAIISGVSVITAGIEALGHGSYIDAVTLSQMEACAKTYAGGLKVVDRHTKGSDSIFSTVGSLRNFRVEGNQLKADLHLLKSEPNSAKLLEMAETIPDTFGLSVAFSGPDEVIGGKTYNRCTELYNAALVDVPAANPTGLFSAKVDTATFNKKPMTPEEFAKVCADMGERMSKFEAALSALTAKPADSTAELSALQTQVKELSANLAKVPDVNAIAQAVAKEFSKATGVTPGVTQKPTDPAPEPAADPVKEFHAVVVKHFGQLKSEAKAVQAAIKEAPTAYAAFRATGKNLPKVA